ncbi:MAG TPA: FecR domain-containing protein [Chitinophaga sp.]|uniref:FecR domain-containing protein n=1 Tax=Chitinophaga sp. TaxID=1869181 RepID=UPI002F95BD63
MDQSNNQDRINFLARKWQEGNITDEERAEFESWYNDFDNSLEISSGESREAMERRLYTRIAERGNIGQRRPFGWPRVAAAAAILLALGTGGYFLAKRDAVKAPVQAVAQDFTPGSNKAVLTLASGEQIILNNAQNGRLAVQGNASVTKKSDGNIGYEATDGHPSGSSAVAFNTVSTPLGGQYHLTLADGTGVWLNAGSSIKFPTTFSGAERKVEISGEVYFEVAHNPAKPFRVMNERQVVEVLGTHFNVNAYTDEEEVRTTLLEGSVRITGSNDSKIIKPGEQAVLGSHRFTIARADTEEAVAWKNGFFRFNDEKIGSIMRKLSRWYDIDVSFKGPVSNEGFNGKISRYKNISQVLRMLEKTGAVQFQIEGRRVIVIQ